MITSALKLRLLLNALIALGILFLPWWTVVLFVLALLVVCEAWEVLLWGVVFDMLYGSPVPFYGDLTFIFTIVFMTLFVFVGVLKRRLIFY